MAAIVQQPMHCFSPAIHTSRPEFALNIMKMVGSSSVSVKCTSLFQNEKVETSEAMPKLGAEAETSDAMQELGVEVEVASSIPHTTVVLSGIPEHLNTEDLLVELLEKGFEDRFDFVYLPIVQELGDERNVGYAYINLRHPADAVDFQRAFHLGHMESNTDRPLAVSVATTQGLEANKDKFRNLEFADPRHRPHVFA
eukprot:TRINITY_DN7957_c0_g2_i1.p1 TRINITY_DN7957_c0_g2~~TRINITY_DN7957_c0_g2_i1.p1  ORF type:complete len:197 (+),score=34.03 TRINITY_DN7957_c0_g2_i1:66-656(+)